ncbi:hypothetical protein R3P38DRAFT_3237450 [Favolaschia claudopus]|uniref:Uncharacterized protein n=1 Tax=Favolaschia claudopus TaxID=2862362 RepID=A0AAV9ZAW6_9AGAR
MTSLPHASGSTPRRKTARMSTGGRPPRKPSPSAFFDLEAEESEDGKGDDVRSQYEGSFICDDDEEAEEEEEEEDPRDYIPWEPSPPLPPKSLPAESQSLTSGKLVPNVQQTSTQGMTTRAKAKKVGATTSSSTSTASGTSIPAQKQLDTLGHDRSGSMSMRGIPSSAVVYGDSLVDTQRRLAFAPTPRVTQETQSASPGVRVTPRSDLQELVHLNIPIAEYNEFRRFMDTLKTPEKPNERGCISDLEYHGGQIGERSCISDTKYPGGEVASFTIGLVTSNLLLSGSGIRRPVDKGKAPMRGGPDPGIAQSLEITGDQDDTPSKTLKLSAKPKAAKSTQKRKRVESTDEPPSVPGSSAVPASALAAFNAAKAEAADASPTPPPVKKTKKINKPAAEPQVFLEEDSIRRVMDLPVKCEVMKAHLQDDMLVATYQSLNLPNLRAFNFHIWSSSKGPGNQRISLYANHIGLILQVLWAFVNFVRKKHIVNLSRSDPQIFQAVNRGIEKDRTKWTLCVDGTTAVCVSVCTVVQSSLQEIGPVNAPSAENANSVPLLKYITGIPLCQEWERATAVCGMVLQDEELYAQINEDAVTFGTRSTTNQRLAKLQSKQTGMKGIPSASTSYSSQSYSFDKSIPYDSSVPVFDGRNREFDVANNIDNLAAILPKYSSDDGEIPNGACVVVAYTVSTYRSAKHQKQNISFNVQWIVVLGDKPVRQLIAAADDEEEDEEENGE